MRPSLRLFTLLAVGATAAPTRPTPVPTPEPMHFRLLEPISWIVEDQRGDPQKAGPCGGSNTDWGTPTYAITKVTGGSTLHIKVQETIYHPGFYRVALAVNSPTELPKDPEAPGGPPECRRAKPDMAVAAGRVSTDAGHAVSCQCFGGGAISRSAPTVALRPYIFSCSTSALIF